MFHARFAAALAALIAFSPIAAAAQDAAAPAPQGAAAMLTMTAKITAIDAATRTVTLQDAQGNTQQIKVGPNVTRFDALKVGDTVTFKYLEAMEVGIAKPGAMPAAQGSPDVTRAPGEKPGGAISQTVTALVTIQAMDLSVPSVTVKGQDGKVVTLHVADKASLDGYKVGDTVQITYTQALIVTVQ